MISFDFTETVFSEADVDLLIEAFENIGAEVVRDGTGKLIVNGTEIDILEALKQGFEDVKEKHDV